MSTNPTFEKKELELLLVTLVKLRHILFDCTGIMFDKNSHPEIKNNAWRGKRGSLPLLEDLEKALTLMRLHVNSEETIWLYDAMGFFDRPKKEDPKGPLSSDEKFNP